MGDEFTTAERPSFRSTRSGTEKIAKVALIRDNEYLYQSTPRTEEITINYTDEHPKKGQASLYYVRLEQIDGRARLVEPRLDHLHPVTADF